MAAGHDAVPQALATDFQGFEEMREALGWLGGDGHGGSCAPVGPACSCVVMEIYLQ
ncbi:hypothetical protein D3C71_2207320 [compost metagenome]